LHWFLHFRISRHNPTPTALKILAICACEFLPCLRRYPAQAFYVNTL
jgi:hypothetical protein